MYQNLTYWLFLWKRILSSPKEKNWSVRFLYKNNEITNCIKIFDNILHPNNITVAIKKVLKNKLTYFSINVTGSMNLFIRPLAFRISSTKLQNVKYKIEVSAIAL